MIVSTLDYYSKSFETGWKAFEKGLSDSDLLTQMWAGDPDAWIQWVKKHSAEARKFHGIWSDWLRELVIFNSSGNGNERQRVIFWTEQIISAMAPSNFFLTNPGAWQRFIKSRGESLQRGFNQWISDVERGDGLIALVDKTAFKVGENIAITPGSVIFKNELMELIQYAPMTEKTHETPIVLVQPWINKYYIFDLRPANSFIRYLVKQGFTVFVTSWKNPTSHMRHVTFDDYLFKGALKAVNVAREICHVNRVHATGYCIGGTALIALMAWLNQIHTRKDMVPIATGTLFSTLADFSDPGNLGVFTGEAEIKGVEALMQQNGFLDASYIGLSFRLLNAENLIWRYVINNYLYGDMPPRSDILFWNCDGTRLPEAMCSFYLRQFYLKNNLAKRNALAIKGCLIDTKAIQQPMYIVGAMQDHISPWKGTFHTCSLVSGPVRYVLAGEGHILGIVNPPSLKSKKKFRAGPAGKTMDPETWLSGQSPRPGSWWTDWVNWLTAGKAPVTNPPTMGSKAYPVLSPAPGNYVLET